MAKASAVTYIPYMQLASLHPKAARRSSARNRLQTGLLAGGSIFLLVLCAYIFAGVTGIIWAALFGAISVWLAQRVSPQMVLKLYRARQIQPEDSPQLAGLVRKLTARADLPAVPALYYVPSNLMNAFAVGGREESAIAVTDGLLRGLDLRQLAGVLAHEMSHIRNQDLKVMALADMVSRMTSAMSTVGLLTLLFYAPTIFSGGAQVPWLGIALLMAAPTIGALLQLALSRTREYEADLDAAQMTGDPEGLASALIALERSQGRRWEMMLPGGRVPQPSVLRTHPKTSERVSRLMHLRNTTGQHIDIPAGSLDLPHGSVPVIPGPRYRLRGMGLWY